MIVATNGRAWLPELLDALRRQTHPLDQLVAIDNASTDGTRDLLIDALGPEGVILSDADVGFPQAVAMGVDALPDVDQVLVLHDDLVPDLDMVEHLVAALDDDPRLAVVGPKLVDHHDPGLLRNVGFTIDRFGRIDRGLERGERDQGQYDTPTRPLAVSSAAMLVRRDVYVGLGGFDRRFRLHRDDLDFCWRVWTAGWQVELVPSARARHRRAAESHDRPGQAAFKGPRFYQERNTLASILKNVPGPRVLVAAVVFVATAALRAVWYLLTRQFADAWQTLRGWLWNLRRLPGTLRRRREVNHRRRLAPTDLNDKFSQLGPQLRQVVSGAMDQVLGGDLVVTDPVASDEEASVSFVRRLLATVRRRPATSVAVVAGIVGLVVSIPLLWSGPLELGQVAPFPASGRVMFSDYLSAWHDVGPGATHEPASPAQALLAGLQGVAVNSPWLASRVLVIGSVVLAWLVALRAARPLAPTTGPRVAAATVYALSPASIAAVRTGRVGPIVALVALPAATIGLHLAVSRRIEGATAWRGAAGAILALGVGIAFEPALLVPVAIVLLALAVWVALRRDRTERRRQAVTRLLVVVVGIPAVLFPWSTTLYAPSTWWPRSVMAVDAATSPTWQWLLQGPDQVGFAGIAAGVGVVAAGLFGVFFASRWEPFRVIALVGVAIIATATAVVLDGLGTSAWAWPGLGLLLAAGALAALFALGLRRVGLALAGHAFGWRQVGAALLVTACIVGIVVTSVDLRRTGWDRGGDPALLPAFIAEAGADGDFTILTLADDGGRLTWDLVDEDGPTMASWGVVFSPGLEATVDAIVESVVAQSDPAAAGRLGLLNIQYVVVPESGRSEDLEQGLERQFDLLSQPVADGLVYRLSNHAPPVGATQPEVVSRILATGSLPAGVTMTPIEPNAAGTRWVHQVGSEPEVVLVATVETGAWRATADGRDLEAQQADGLLRFDAPPDSRVELLPVGQTPRTASLVLQVLAVLLVVSVLLRPPASATSAREVR